MSMFELDYYLSVFGRVWPFKFRFRLGLDAYLYFPGLAVGGFESLTALRGFVYMMNVSF